MSVSDWLYCLSPLHSPVQKNKALEDQDTSSQHFTAQNCLNHTLTAIQCGSIPECCLSGAMKHGKAYMLIEKSESYHECEREVER